MLVKPSTEGGLGNPADQQIRIFNTRFGSRSVKKPRLSTDSVVTNGFCSRSGTRMKPLQNGTNAKTDQNMIHSTQDDDTTSTSGDERLFVIQVRSPTSKQLLHGQKTRQSREEHADGNNNGSDGDPKHELYSHGLSRNATKEVDMERQVGHQVHEFAPSGMMKEASAVELSGAGREGEGAAMKSSEVVNVYVRKRKRSTAADTATVDSVPFQEHGFSQSEALIKHYVRRKHHQTDSHGSADVIEKPSEHVKVNEGATVHPTDTYVQVEEGYLNVFQRRSKKIPIISHVETPDVLTPKMDEGEGKLNVFRRRAKVNTLPDAEASQAHLNVFQRRSKLNPVSHAENLDADVARVENRHVFHRRSMKKHENSHARAENLNVFQRRSNMSQVPQVENQPVKAKQHVDVKAKQHVDVKAKHHVDVKAKHHVDVKAKHHVDVKAKHHVDVKHYDVEEEGNFNVFRRRSKVPEPENVGNFHVFQRRAKVNSEKKEDELEEAESEKVGYVRAEHQPGWLPEGWTLEAREGKTAVKPRDKYYHHNQSGRIFRSQHEVLHFLGDARVGARSLMSEGSDMNQKTPPVAVADATANSSGDGTQLRNDASPAKSPSDQENRGKLILRLKRKQPDSEAGGKGRSKRPMYEVIHGEKASSSTSTPTKPPSQDNNIPPTPRSVQRITSLTLPVKPTQIKESHIPQQNPRSEQQEEPDTVLGIPATSYIANHTHIFLENTIPSSWHHPHAPFSLSAPATAAELTGDEGPQVHKALKALKASRAVTKLDHTKLFLDLGRRLCLAGVEHTTRR